MVRHRREKVREVSGTGLTRRRGMPSPTPWPRRPNANRSSEPTLIARTIARAVRARKPRTRYAVGFGAKPMIFLHNVLPDRAFDSMMRRVTGVPSV